MLVSQSIPGMYNGMSQQPATQRLATQCENQLNAIGSLVDGLYKRPNTEFVAVLETTAIPGTFVQEINRDVNERYILVITGHPTYPIEVFTQDGVKCTIRYGYLDEDLNFTENNEVKNYITTGVAQPVDKIKAQTIADYTIISNSMVQVAMDPLETPGQKVNEAFAYVKISAINTTYRIEVDSYSGTYLTNDTKQTSTDVIASNLYTSITSESGFTTDFNIEHRGSILRITRKDGGDFSFTVKDGYGDKALIGIKGRVSTYTDLPSHCWDGTVVEVKQAKEGEFATSYFVQFQSSDGNTGSWVETRKWGIQNKFDIKTMPHRLVRTGVNEFTFSPILWEERLVGDEDTNPTPSFVGSYINDVTFFRNRLGFLSQDNVILSRAGDYFNFWAKTALDILDDDPIDIAATGSEPSVVPILRYARAFESNLMLISDQVQFSLSSGNGPLTPSSVVVDSTTHFRASTNIPPVASGANLYFLSPEANYSKLREYFVQPDTLVTDAADVTGHVPNLLTIGSGQMVACPSLDMVFILFNNLPTYLFVYKYYWQGTEKVQSSWCRWQFWHGILGMAIFDTTLYLVITDLGANQSRLVKLDLNKAYTDSLEFKVHLDDFVPLLGSYDSQTGYTTWTLPYNDSVDNPYWVVVNSGNGLPVEGAVKYGNNIISAPGNYSGGYYYCGKVYTTIYEFSECFVRNNDISSIDGRLQLRTISLAYVNTGYFRLEITPENNSTIVHEYSGVEVGKSTIGRPAIVDGPKRFLVMSKANKTRIKLVNDTYLPCFFQSASIEGFFVKRSRFI